jgi:uncharacterized C2H2 Zn-finger protein
MHKCLRSFADFLYLKAARISRISYPLFYILPSVHYQRHVERVHLKVRKNACAECGARFYEKRDLVRHTEAAHLHIKTLCPIQGCNKV